MYISKGKKILLEELCLPYQITHLTANCDHS